MTPSTKSEVIRRLREVVESPPKGEGLTAERLADPMDKTIKLAEVDTQTQILDKAMEKWKEAKRALGKKSYDLGMCERCEEGIPDVRMLAVPWTRYCIGCQEKIERRPTQKEEDDFKRKEYAKNDRAGARTRYGYGEEFGRDSLVGR